MFRHTTQLRVRYSETDQMGQVYYGQFATYFEVGRVEAMRSIGMAYAEIEEKLGVLMPVMNLHVRYLRPVRYDDLIEMTTTISRMPEMTITFESEIKRADGKLCAAGRVGLCFLEASSKKRVPIPEFLATQLKPYFEDS